ncbi:MAG: hypothetical protein KDA41_18000 [Planctomycetales bacterium]|nr:hypothetical protein [Planctomycetales bacterium]
MPLRIDGRFAAAAALLLSALTSGCQPPQAAAPQATLTASSERAARRAYDGAPPVIPHARLGASCVECHTQTGKAVPERGFAPANPHAATAGLGAAASCLQCHLFKNDDGLFAENDFQGQAQVFVGGERLYPHAPPVMPHRAFMRENCNACHSGPSARPEIRCSHPDRVNCRQCHVESTDRSSVSIASQPLGTPAE